MKFRLTFFFKLKKNATYVGYTVHGLSLYVRGKMAKKGLQSPAIVSLS
jgi:hypothetical protein